MALVEGGRVAAALDLLRCKKKTMPAIAPANSKMTITIKMGEVRGLLAAGFAGSGETRARNCVGWAQCGQLMTAPALEAGNSMRLPHRSQGPFI
jgi:hypothetical protein